MLAYNKKKAKRRWKKICGKSAIQTFENARNNIMARVSIDICRKREKKAISLLRKDQKAKRLPEKHCKDSKKSGKKKKEDNSSG